MRFRVGLVLVGCFCLAHPALAQQRGWLDVNFASSAPAEDGYTARFEPIIFQEVATFEADYSFPSGSAFDVGFGYMVTSRIGVGLAIGRTSRKDPAALFISIPDPDFFDNNGEDTGSTDEDLERSERTLHIQAMIALVSTPRLQVRAFVGPTRFSVEQDTIEDINFTQALPGFNNIITIVGSENLQRDDSAWGAHGGADVSYFFTSRVGVGGLFRISRATVELEDMGGAVTSEIKVGGTEFGGGLRLRF